MSTLQFVDLKFRAADFPKPSALWDFGKQSGDVHSTYKRSPDMPEDVQINPDDGAVPSILPYSVQNDYDRVKRERSMRAAVLENDRLRATFIPRLGGRLWSLFDKQENRELLHANPVFQPANLALRNAWFSGGIEWNISIIGHTPFTCSQLFTERYDDPERGPVLRMYEFERVRQAVYQMDFWLPDGSAFLLARMSILNTTDHEIPMYWWTNMAVEEREDVRVIVPADKSLELNYTTGLGFRPFPETLDTDASYTMHLNRAIDFFFYIPPKDRKYIAAVDGTGTGYVQTSTSALKGRKLFVWGMNKGGRRWQEFLAEPGRAYLEIQAGLGHSQMEYLHMPANSRYEWMEAFGPIRVPADAAHGAWHDAVAAAGSALETVLPAEWLEQELLATRAMSERIAEPVEAGSGWGALENMRRQKMGGACLPSWLHFDESSLTEEQRPWLSLLVDGMFPFRPAEGAAASYQIQPEWRELLETYCTEHPENAAAWLHLGILRNYLGDSAAAKAAWENAQRIQPSAWSARALAMWTYQNGDPLHALTQYAEACRMRPDEWALAVEFGGLCMEQKRYEDFLQTLDSMSAAVRNHPRVRLLQARCLIETGRIADGEAILLSGVEVPDIKEGEVLTTDLWFRAREKELAAKEGIPESKELAERVRRECQPPQAIDFRMS